MDRTRVVIAEILRPRGNRGELLAKSQTDIPGRLEALKNAQACLADGSDVPVELASAWQHKAHWVLKLTGIDSIGEAERFRGADLWVPYSNRGTLAEGEFFQSDLIGCEVIDRSGRRLGIVRGWQQYGGPPLMEIAIDGQEALIPFVNALCNVNLNERTVHVDLPEGLLDL